VILPPLPSFFCQNDSAAPGCLKVGATDEDLGMIGLFWNLGG
jgi:hypothetical protein